jgi:hypothetical protein
MNTTGQILEGHTSMEKIAYLAAIASLATAKRMATPEEIEELEVLCEEAGLYGKEKQSVLNAANDISVKELCSSLGVLKNSELKYSLIADLVTFSKTESDHCAQEQHNINEIAKYLDVNDTQKSALNDFADSAVAHQQATTSKGFLPFSSVSEKLKKAGINARNLLNGMLGFAAPMIVVDMVNNGVKGINNWRRNFQGAGRGLFGGSGSLGSILGMFDSGRSFGSSRIKLSAVSKKTWGIELRLLDIQS